MIAIRAEQGADAAELRALNEAAFGRPDEADLVDRLRTGADPFVSLVAESGQRLVGHLLLTPVSLSNRSALSLMGLGPMAVRPEWQRRGIGSRLVTAGLERCRLLGCHGVVVLGHEGYYPRFGFVPARRFGIECEFEGAGDAFMAVELSDGGFRGCDGCIARYHPAFGP